jgi:hypothetical protein
VTKVISSNSSWRNNSSGHSMRIRKITGVDFIDENGGGPGVQLRKRHQKKD